MTNIYLGAGALKPTLLQAHLTYDAGDYLLIPSGFYKVEPEFQQEHDGTFDRTEEMARLTFLDHGSSLDFFEAVVVQMGCHHYTASGSRVVLRQGDDEVCITEGTKEVCIRTSDLRSPLYREALEVMQSVQEQLDVALKFFTPISSQLASRVMIPSEKNIQYWEEDIERKRELREHRKRRRYR